MVYAGAGAGASAQETAVQAHARRPRCGVSLDRPGALSSGVPSCGQRACIAHFGSVASAVARPSAPPRWRGLVGWRQQRGAGCWRAHGAVRDRSPGRLVGHGGSGVPSAEIALGRELCAYAAEAEARGGSTMPGLNTCRASAAYGSVGSEHSAARDVCSNLNKHLQLVAFRG